MALVGASGSGKTTTGLAILRLLSPALQIMRGQVIFQKENLLKSSLKEMEKIRGKEIAMVFQEPLNAFNPVFKIGYQIEEVLMCHTPLSKAQRRKRVLELLDKAGLRDPLRAAQSFPHQLSAGMRQRAMIAQAIALSPKLIIADEPTSNLDVTLQARIMELFNKLKNDLKASILLITHDLGLVEHFADSMVILYQGGVVEAGSTKDIFNNPQHAYTQQLLAN